MLDLGRTKKFNLKGSVCLCVCVNIVEVALVKSQAVFCMKEVACGDTKLSSSSGNVSGKDRFLLRLLLFHITLIT